jgi:beta-N-acetylhexosaminidase
VAKHFPGHGDTAVDSHFDLPVVQSIELQPFRAAIQAGAEGVMTGHLYAQSVEPEPGRPATLSHAVLTGLLRERLGYTGLILTDALDMGAIKSDRGAAEAAVEAFEAGADMLLVAGITGEDRTHLGDGPPALLAAVRSGRVSEQRLDASVVRILQTKARRGILGCQVAPPPMVRHDELALEVARQAITLQRDDAGVLPLRPEQKVLVVVPDAPTRSRVQDDQLASSLLEAVQRFAPTVTETALADVIVLGTYDLAQDPTQQALARSLQATGKPVVGVSLRGPYDAPFLPTMLAAYGDRPVHLHAAAEALFGQLKPSGRAP